MTLDCRNMPKDELYHALMYPNLDYFDGMSYDDWLFCVKINPSILLYAPNQTYITSEVVVTALSLNCHSLAFIKGYKLGYDDYLQMYKVGKMSLFYQLYEHIDLNNAIVQQAIEDAKYFEVKDAYDQYCEENHLSYTVDGWKIFSEFFTKQRDMLESIKGISDYHTYTLCKNLKDDEKISTEAYSYHSDPDRLSSILMNLAKEIVNNYE